MILVRVRARRCHGRILAYVFIYDDEFDDADQFDEADFADRSLPPRATRWRKNLISRPRIFAVKP